MEIKNWIYEEFPEYTEKVEGAVRISATGNEMKWAFITDRILSMQR